MAFRVQRGNSPTFNSQPCHCAPFIYVYTHILRSCLWGHHMFRVSSLELACLLRISYRSNLWHYKGNTQIAHEDWWVTCEKFWVIQNECQSLSWAVPCEVTSSSYIALTQIHHAFSAKWLAENVQWRPGVSCRIPPWISVCFLYNAKIYCITVVMHYLYIW